MDRSRYTYPELEFDALNTPVQDWRCLFNYMTSHDLSTLFDAGAGHALSAQVAQAEFPNIHVTAWEIVADRIKNLNCPKHDICVADLMTRDIPVCDVTFLYLPTGPLLERVLSQLPEGALIAAVESHGELFARLEESASLQDQLSIAAKRHHPMLRIYRWQKPLEEFKQQIRQLSFTQTENQLLVKEQDPFEGEILWLADVEGVTVTPDEFVETIFPERRFLLSQVVKITSTPWLNLIQQRRQGLWRKIIVSPRLLKETPEGARLVIDAKESSLDKTL